MTASVTLPAAGTPVVVDQLAGSPAIFEVVKINVGGAGLDAPLSPANPMPVSNALGATAANQVLELTALAAAHTDLAAILAQLVLVLAKLPASPALDSTVAATNTALAMQHADMVTLHADVGTTLHADVTVLTAALTARLAALHPDGGTPSHITNFPTTQPVSGTMALDSTALAALAAAATPTTQTVSGPATDAQLRASALPVSVSGGATAANQVLQIAALGASTDAAAVNDAATASIIALMKRLNGKFSGYSITQTSLAVTATSQTLIAANAARKYLAWMIIGTADVTVAAGAAAAVVGAGLVYQASGVNKQGASEEFPNGAPTNAFQAIAAATGSTMIIWEGV